MYFCNSLISCLSSTLPSTLPLSLLQTRSRTATRRPTRRPWPTRTVPPSTRSSGTSAAQLLGAWAPLLAVSATRTTGPASCWAPESSSAQRTGTFGKVGVKGREDRREEAGLRLGRWGSAWVAAGGRREMHGSECRAGSKKSLSCVSRRTHTWTTWTHMHNHTHTHTA